MNDNNRDLTKVPATPRRYGGDWQPRLDDFGDAVAALQLPNTAWAVLSCPIDGMELATDFAALIDRDGDGRVRADDVRLAVRWTAERLNNWSAASSGTDVLRLADIAEPFAVAREAGRALAATLGRADELTLSDLRNPEALTQCGDRDGDGVVSIACISAPLDSLAAAIIDIGPIDIGTIDSGATSEATQRSSAGPANDGITIAWVDRFAAARDVWQAWCVEPGPHLPWNDDSR